MIQNQHGPKPTKWNRSGVIVEVRDFDKYIVKVDGSGRLTLRNRKFLKKLFSDLGLFRPPQARPDALLNNNNNNTSQNVRPNRRQRCQRKMYDANTGKYVLPNEP